MQKQFLDNTGLAELLEELGQYLKEIKADKTELPLVVQMGGDLQTCDTSIVDIYTAYSTGRVVQMKIDDFYTSLSLVSSNSSEAKFAVTDEDLSLIISGSNESGSDVWTLDSFTAQEKLTFDSTPTTGSQNPVTSNGIKTALDGKQDTLVSGTNIKTINNTSLLGNGNISIEPNEIVSITTSESSDSGGNNTVTITETDGTTTTFNVKNGVDGVSLGEVALVQTTGDSEESVMSQKAVTDAIQYNISTEHGEGFTVNSNNTYRYIKLTPKAVSLLNASDKMTFMFSTRATGGNQDYRYFRFGNGSTTTNQVDGTNGVYVGWSYSRNLSANGVDYTLNKTGSNYVTPDVWVVTWDRINGIVKFYDHTTLVNTLTSDSYKKDKFVNDGGLLAFVGGNNNARIYDIRLFDYDISFLFGYADVSTEINCLCGAGVLPALFLDNYQTANNDGSFKSSVNGFSGGGSTTCTYTWDGDDYHIVVKDGTTTSQVCGGKPHYLGRDNSAQIEKLEFQVVSGVIKHCWRTNQPNENLNYRLILDSNGEEIADYDNIGVGNYTLIKTQGAVGSRFDFYKVSGNVEVVINRNMQYRPISCVFHLRGDTMYNKKFYDDQTESFITLYSDRTCATEYTTHTMVKTPQRIIRNNISTSDGLPHYPGEMAVVGNKVYVGLADYTWKQINNS